MLITAPYMPSINSRNAPLMPGRIMAHTATAPAPASTGSEGSATGPDCRPSRANVAAVDTAVNAIWPAPRHSNSRHADTAEAATSPQNRPAIVSGCSSSWVSITEANSMIVPRIPASSGTINHQSTIASRRQPPRQSPRSSVPAPPATPRIAPSSRS